MCVCIGYEKISDCHCGCKSAWSRAHPSELDVPTKDVPARVKQPACGVSACGEYGEFGCGGLECKGRKIFSKLERRACWDIAVQGFQCGRLCFRAEDKLNIKNSGFMELAILGPSFRNKRLDLTDIFPLKRKQRGFF